MNVLLTLLNFLQKINMNKSRSQMYDIMTVLLNGEFTGVQVTQVSVRRPDLTPPVP